MAAATSALTGLPFDEFVDRSFELLMLRSPQLLTELGVAEDYGFRNNRLDDLSDAFRRETRALEAGILSMLHAYDRSALDTDSQVVFDTYEWYLDDLVRGHRFAYHDYPLNHFLLSYHLTTVAFFTDTFAIATVEDARDYIACVAQIRRQAGEVLEGLRIREALGIIPPDFVVAMAAADMSRQVGRHTPYPADVDPTRLEIYTRFEAATGQMASLDASGRDRLLEELEQALAESFVPAWFELIEELARLRDAAAPDAGVWRLPEGEAFYAQAVRRETSTDLTVQEIHAIGLDEVSRIHGEMREIFDGLGYPADEALAASMERVWRDGGVVDTAREGPAPLVAAYEDLLAEVSARLGDVFGLQPEAGLIVVPELSFSGGGGYYSSASLDGSRPGAFHTGAAPGMVGVYRMPTLAYHEGIPGHHFQVALTRELDLPLFQSVVFFNGYVEGWALYAEYLAAEMGLYDGDPYGNLGRLHMELLRAVRLVTDTGLHAMGWTREEAKEYVRAAMGEPAGRSDHEVDRYVVLPAQALGYKVGMLEILALRRRAETALGDEFDLRRFHDVVLGHGAVPLEVLGRIVDDWISDASR